MDDGYVEGLTGEEIINDVLAQVEAKLRSDCNLREMDAYLGGYDGTVHVQLNLRGVDLAEVKRDIIVSAPADATFSGDAPVKENTVDVQVDIAPEPRLNVVRERSGQDVPTLSKDENGAVVVKKRHYARKTKPANKD